MENHQSTSLVRVRDGKTFADSRDVAAAFDDFASRICGFEDVARLALSDPNEALAKIELYRGHEPFPFIRAAIIAMIAQTIKNKEHLERDVRSEFYRNLRKYIPGATFVSAKKIDGKVCDGVVLFKGRECPVEIKRDVFCEKALNQLLGYMKIHDAEIGIAVAQKLACRLPENILFVAVDMQGELLQ